MAHILIVDDEPDIRVYLQTIFEDAGHDVRVASNGREGEAVLSEFTPDFAVLDIIMPVASGVNLYRAIRGNPALHRMPVIFLSAVVRHRDQLEDQMKGLPEPEAWVDKPFKADRMVQLVESLLSDG